MSDEELNKLLAERKLQRISEDEELGEYSVPEKGSERKIAPIKQLNAKHRQIIALLLGGYSNLDIAAILNLSACRVSQVRNDPQVQRILQRHFNDTDAELSALFPQAVDAIRRNLGSGDSKAALRASELFLKSQGKIQSNNPGVAGKGEVTAEDVAKEIIEIEGKARITKTSGNRLKITHQDTQE